MLAVSHVSKSFEASSGASIAALSDINLAVQPGEIVGLVGTSGCGKSTLLRIISGLEQPTGGAVTLDGRTVTGPTVEVGLVFQEPRLMPWLTVRENVRLALIGVPKAEQETLIEEALRKVGLSGFVDALPRQLSGGMAQRAAIARALVRRPQVLLLDEPFSALDPFTRQRLQEHLLDLWEAEGLTMVLVTHDVEEAVAMSDRIVAMRAHPGRAHRSFAVDLERPRDRTAPEFQALKRAVTAALDLSHIDEADDHERR